MSEFFYLGDIQNTVKALGEVAHSFSGKKVLISGGAGFLGRYFVEIFSELNRSVLKEPVEVLAMDNLITSARPDWKEDGSKLIRFQTHNVVQPLNLDTKYDYIIHAAGIASPFYYRANPIETLDVAINGTRNMLETAAKMKAKFLFFSTSEVYGDPDAAHVPTEETYRGNVASLGPRACYDESKRVGETLCYIFNTQGKVETNIIRPFNVYGPGMKEKDYRVLPNFASRIVSNQALHVYASGTQTRTFCYITDAMNGFIRVLVNGVPGEPYNIGNPKPEISMTDLVKETEKAIGKSVKVERVAYPNSYPADEPQRRCPNIYKAQKDVGYIPQVDLSTGLKRFYEWAFKNYQGLV